MILGKLVIKCPRNTREDLVFVEVPRALARGTFTNPPEA